MSSTVVHFKLSRRATLLASRSADDGWFLCCHSELDEHFGQRSELVIRIEPAWIWKNPQSGSPDEFGLSPDLR